MAGASFTCLRLELGGVEYMDSTGIALVEKVRRVCADRGSEFVVRGMSDRMEGLVRMVDLEALAGIFEGAPRRAGPRRKAVSFVKREMEFIGGHAILLVENLRYILTFIGDVVLTLLWAVRHPRAVRARDVLECLERNGADALPIVALVNGLVGMVLAFQAAVQLRQFGADIYVADLVGIAQVREFGPMITAILLAGRSGSAFAAEIGSMKINEEVDAIVTMGLDPTRFLVLPKVLALLIALPVLALFANVVGIIGGLLVSVTSLDLTVQGYLLETKKAVGLFDVFSGVSKTLVFALIVAGVGCLRGFQVESGAVGVGRAATSTVVTGIFLIILVDAIFAVVFQYV